MLPLTHRHISLCAAIGIIYTLRDVIGDGGLSSIFSLTAEKMLPLDSDPQTERGFLNKFFQNMPLRFIFNQIPPSQPIDWADITVLRLGMIEIYGEKSNPAFLFRIGCGWWNNRSYNDDANPYSLCRIAGEMISQGLQQRASTIISIAYAQSMLEIEGYKKYIWDALIEFALITLALVFTFELGIPVQTMRQGSTFFIHMPDCPFCQQQPPDCYVFKGVIYSMLCWLTHYDDPLANYVVTMIPFPNHYGMIHLNCVDKNYHHLCIEIEIPPLSR